MNEIERAFNFLTGLKLQYKDKAYAVRHFEVALAALREKQERSKGCKFCNEEYAVMSGNRMTRDAIHKGCTAKFCPMCGKPLEVEHDNTQAET